MRRHPWMISIGLFNSRRARATAYLTTAAFAVLSVGASTTGLAQKAAGISRAHPPAHVQITSPRALPLSVREKELTRVVVIMSNESVAQVRAQTAGLQISAQDHAAIHAQVAQQHAAIEPTIVSRGGRVLRHYYDALNGMKVEIARSEVDGLRNIPGVVSVAGVGHYRINNTISVPFIDAPLVWQGTPAFRGEHVKIAMIDTGIDYTHADFGGPGTVVAYTKALSTDSAAPDGSLVGPKAPKVKGGTDLVGDAYNADDPNNNTPIPDPNPLDCNGHGSHTAGTAGGFGVALDGSTYHGPYNQAAYTTGFGIGPGVAPLADLYAVKVFGCTGSTDEVVDAIDWAVDNNMDVISMSLGAPYGGANTADALAADAASKAGIIVVAAAGNEGPGLYVASTPASGTRAISVAAMDPHQFLLNGVILTLSGGASAGGVNENHIALPQGPQPAAILVSNGALSLGCDASDFAGVPSGALVVLARGTCPFQQKMDNAMAAGASAVGVVNNAAGFVSPLLSGVTIPFISLLQSDGPKFVSAASGETATLVVGNVPNAGYRMAATFSSGGPRFDDGSLKPEISAPGVDVVSVLFGSGNASTDESGTSMATPHVAGVAALTLQAHPNWGERALRSAIIETSSPSALTDFSPRLEGMGLVQPVGSTQTTVTVAGVDESGLGPLSFGVGELTKDFQDTRELMLKNHGSFPATFNVSVTQVSGVPHTVKVSSSTISVRGKDTANLRVSLQVPAGTVGGTHDAQQDVIYEEAAGYITLKPVDSFSNGGVTLRLPYYFVPRARSNVGAALKNGKQLAVHVDNRNGVIAGNADFYAWGLKNPKTNDLQSGFGPRAIGVQSNVIAGATPAVNDSVLVFAINTYQRVSNFAAGEYDISIDVNGDGKPDFVLFSQDVGTITTGTANGQAGTFLLNLATSALLQYPIDAPTDGSVVELLALASDLGITPANPQFSYSVAAFDPDMNEEDVASSAAFNAFNPALSNAIFVTVPPNAAGDIPVGVNAVQLRATPTLGFMVVTEDNTSGASEANLLSIPKK